MLGKIAGKRRRGQQRMRRLGNTIDSIDMNLSKFWEISERQRSPEDCSPWCCKESDMIKRLSNNNNLKIGRELRNNSVLHLSS